MAIVVKLALWTIVSFVSRVCKPNKPKANQIEFEENFDNFTLKNMNTEEEFGREKLGNDSISHQLMFLGYMHSEAN